MPDKLIIPELGEKVRFLLEKHVNGIYRQKELENQLNKKTTFVSKLNNSIDKATFELLCKAYPEIPIELWKTASTDEFIEGLKEIGVVKKPTNGFLNGTIVSTEGINFKARERDMDSLKHWFERLQGYWEVFSYSTNTTNKNRYIHHGFLEITQLKENGFIECEIQGKNYPYKGLCYPHHNTLYFLFEEAHLYREMLFMMMRLPSLDNRLSMNGVCSFPTAPASSKISLRQVSSLEEIKQYYGITENNVALNAALSDEIEHRINQNHQLLNTEILDAIDNHIPTEVIPYALCADGKRHVPKSHESPDKIMSVLQAQIDALTEHMNSVQQDCIRDYWWILQNALCHQTCYLVKPSHYRERLVTLAEASREYIIATYWHDNYQHYANNDAAAQISLAYLEAQARMIRERNVSVQRVFISTAKQPDETLLARMRQEQAVGIEVYYLSAEQWQAHPWNLNSAVDFAVFDGKIALVLGENDQYSWMPKASVTSNENELRNLIDLFRLNQSSASLWNS